MHQDFNWALTTPNPPVLFPPTLAYSANFTSIYIILFHSHSLSFSYVTQPTNPFAFLRCMTANRVHKSYSLTPTFLPSHSLYATYFSFPNSLPSLNRFQQRINPEKPFEASGNIQ